MWCKTSLLMRNQQTLTERTKIDSLLWGDGAHVSENSKFAFCVTWYANTQYTSSFRMYNVVFLIFHVVQRRMIFSVSWHVWTGRWAKEITKDTNKCQSPSTPSPKSLSSNLWTTEQDQVRRREWRWLKMTIPIHYAYGWMCVCVNEFEWILNVFESQCHECLPRGCCCCKQHNFKNKKVMGK